MEELIELPAISTEPPELIWVKPELLMLLLFIARLLPELICKPPDLILLDKILALPPALITEAVLLLMLLLFRLKLFLALICK